MAEGIRLTKKYMKCQPKDAGSSSTWEKSLGSSIEVFSPTTVVFSGILRPRFTTDRHLIQDELPILEPRPICVLLVAEKEVD